MISLKNRKILVTGGSGFLGSYVAKHLKKEGVSEIIIPRSKDFDLREKSVCQQLVKDIDYVFHIAANIGGIGFNKSHPGQIFYDNAIMGLNLMEEACKAGVKKMLVIGTACSYPKYCILPFHESDFWAGYPDEITGFYGLAKKMLWVQGLSYRKEYGFNSVHLILVNLYGPGDNFDSVKGHVISSLVARMMEAKRKKEKKFVVWGSGTATREFIYVDDAAKGIIAALKQYEGESPVNLGTGKEISIHNLVILLQHVIGFEGEIVWDTTKPDGQPRRVVDPSLAKKTFGFEAKTQLEQGLKKTISWYLKQSN